MELTNKVYLPIPGFFGGYLISSDGEVINRDGHTIKPIQAKDGLRVELRRFGQRDRFLVDDLVKITWGGAT